METPKFNHLTAEDFQNVYEPAEDSFLLLDALEADISFIETLDPKICVEIGSGSGIIITALSNKFHNSMCLASDINGYACIATARTAQYNSANVEVIQCNLLQAIRPHSVDLLVCNPPYVITTDDEVKTGKLLESANELTYAWAGGQNGRYIIDMLLAELDTILSPIGVLYLLLLRENNPEEIVRKLGLMNFLSEKVLERRIPGEQLCILKVHRRVLRHENGNEKQTSLN